MKSNSELVYEDLVARGKKKNTAKSWSAIVRKFEGCCGVKDDYSRGDIINFLASLRENGIKQNSINTIMRPIKLLCEIQGWEGGWHRLSMQKVKSSDISRPRCSLEQIEYLIRKARNLKDGKGKLICSESELAYIAVSTTYGLRREEIGTLEIYDGHVRVNTAKGGEPTNHLVPGSIKCYLKGYRRVNDVRYLTRLFWIIVNKVGLDIDSGYGWHSIRRALTTELADMDIAAMKVMRFMRWSEDTLKREFGMMAIYAAGEQEDIDRYIFKVHPFLKYWK
jgi:hypothetical protein